MPGLVLAHLAFVEEEKITRYLLDVNHKDGGPKATVFLRYGFHLDRPDELRRALLEIGRSGQMSEVHGSTGIKYVVDGACRTPDGRSLYLRTVWHAAFADDPPRLVSAYPRKP